MLDGDESCECFYPFTEAGGAYSGSVTAFASEDAPGPTFKVAVISLAAQDLRPDCPYPTSPTFEYAVLFQNLRSLFHIALVHGHTRLVLGAIGCGAFRNPPEEVARAYATLLSTEFQGCFENVVFAVSRSPRNLEAFKAALLG